YGAYELVSWSGTGYSIVPYPFSGTPTQDNNVRYIPSGAGFLVRPVDNTGGALTIDESAKAPTPTTLINPFRQSGTVEKLYVNLNLKNSDSSATLADGVLASFSDKYSADI